MIPLLIIFGKLLKHGLPNPPGPKLPGGAGPPLLLFNNLFTKLSPAPGAGGGGGGTIKLAAEAAELVESDSHCAHSPSL